MQPDSTNSVIDDVTSSVIEPISQEITEPTIEPRKPVEPEIEFDVEEDDEEVSENIFESWGLSKEVLKSLAEMKFTNPTSIQTQRGDSVRGLQPFHCRQLGAPHQIRHNATGRL